MNYASLSDAELASLCRTDEGARRYVAENAEDILSEIEEMRNHYNQETWDEAYHQGCDKGVEMARATFREKYDKDLEWALGRIEKQHGGIPNENTNASRLWDLLQALRGSFE